jgi:hypothetical protein
MPVDLEHESFVMIFFQELVFGFVPRSIKGAFQVDSASFTAVDDNFLSAFWDRLLDARGQLVGVRVTPISGPAEQLRAGLSGVPYVTSDGEAFEVWLSEAPLADVNNNAEQAFGGQVFRSSDGRFALSVDADFLFTRADEARLMNAHGKWATITPER